MSAGILVAGLIVLYVVASGKAAAMWAALTGQAPPGASPSGGAGTPAAGGQGTDPTVTAPGGADVAAQLGMGSNGSGTGTQFPPGYTGQGSSPYAGIGGYGAG